MPDQLSHAQLWNMRDKLGPNSPEGTKLAPAEHQAFAREWTAENPLVAAPSLAVAAPLYYAAKNPLLMAAAQHMGLVGPDATPASLDQLISSYKGILEGLQQQTTQSPIASTGKGSSPTAPPST
jgi:hypothetical protein